jgi:hypothetical protein
LATQAAARKFPTAELVTNMHRVLTQVPLQRVLAVCGAQPASTTGPILVRAASSLRNVIETVAAKPETFTIEHWTKLPPDWVIGGDASVVVAAGVGEPVRQAIVILDRHMARLSATGAAAATSCTARGGANPLTRSTVDQLTRSTVDQRWRESRQNATTRLHPDPPGHFASWISTASGVWLGVLR